MDKKLVFFSRKMLRKKEINHFLLLCINVYWFCLSSIITLLLCATRFEGHLTNSTCHWVGILTNYFVLGVGNLLLFLLRICRNSYPMPTPPSRSGLPLIGALIWYFALWKSLDKISTDCTLIDLPIWSASTKATNLLKLQAVSHSICSNIPIQTSFALHLCQYQSNYHFH